MPGISHIRDAVLLSGAVLLGGVIASVLPPVGFGLVAAGMAALVFRGRATVAAVAGGATVALGTFAVPLDAILLAPVLAAIMLLIGVMQRRSALFGVAVLTAVMTAGSLASDAARAWLQGASFVERMRETTAAAVAAFVEAAGGVGADGTLYGVDPEMLADMMFRLWPLDYFATALVSALVSVAVIGWVAGRSGAAINRLPRLDVLDLSPHVLWPFIGAFAFLAAGRAMADGELATTVGLNLLLGVRLLLLAQGLAVVSAFYRRIGLGKWARGAGYVLLALADSVIPLVSMVGLIDFWANLRKLPRADSSETRGVEDGDGGG